MQQWHDWPAKSPHPPETVEHPAIYHMLDVAAVAECLITSFPFSDSLKQAFVALAGLHDLGKFSESFRNMLRNQAIQIFKHWELTEFLLRAEDSLLEEWLGSDEDIREILYAAVAGHHGCPPDINFQEGRTIRQCKKTIGEGADPARQLIEIFRDCWPDASLDSLDEEEAIQFSWWLPGFCTTADWIGSNTTYFPPQGWELSPAEYLEQARSKAAVAVRMIGLDGTELQQGVPFDFELRPLQAACATVSLPEGPTLVVLEDETGSGKTEAALILAQRMMRDKKGRGLFFALPTMATADAMFARAAVAIERMFNKPSLTLAHGKAGLSDRFRDIVRASCNVNDSSGGMGIRTSDWLAEDNRRALLADVGVGTIDQALLSVLPVRFQTLRHYGLSSKILIVDEVHEMGEPYIAEELATLLTMHRAMGGSAILLTATLPLKLREKLLKTYDGSSEEYAYPAITVAGGESVTSFASDNRPGKGAVGVERIASAGEAVAYIRQAAMQGAACVWVRNAVDDAIAAVEELRAAGVEAQLLHARFALCDRKQLEASVLKRVGRDGQNRKGFVLVSTQIVEASLDIDFDVMVSDLAPMGSLIQRAGRLWRHMDKYPAESRPVPAPVLKVLSPDPATLLDETWLRQTLEKGAWTYDLPAMWRTATVLFRKGEITAPEGLRDLIEAVEGEQAEELPEALLTVESNVLGGELAARSQALQNVVNPENSYREAGRGRDDLIYPTRLGEDTQILALARWTGDTWEPWAQTDEPIVTKSEDSKQYRAAQWMLSEVSVRSRKLMDMALPDQDRPDIIALKEDWPEWKKENVILCPVGTGKGEICEGLYYDETRGLIFHSAL